jgi:hypothetical protein
MSTSAETGLVLNGVADSAALETPLTPREHLRDKAVWIKSMLDDVRWRAGAVSGPAPHRGKQRMILRRARLHGLTTFVETGTYFGDMVSATRRNFKRVFSIELSPDLHLRARRRFRNDPNVTLICGDSADELGKLVHTLDAPALFWLDGHYSAGVTARGTKITPVFEELQHIFESKVRGHVALIDDCRLFGSDPGYPSLIELIAFVSSANSKATVAFENDSIVVKCP